MTNNIFDAQQTVNNLQLEADTILSRYTLSGIVKYDASLMKPQFNNPEEQIQWIAEEDEGFSVVLSVSTQEGNDMFERIKQECNSRMYALESKNKKSKNIVEYFSPIKEEFGFHNNCTGNYDLFFKKDAKNKDGKLISDSYIYKNGTPYFSETEIGRGSRLTIDFYIGEEQFSFDTDHNGTKIKHIKRFITLNIINVHVETHSSPLSLHYYEYFQNNQNLNTRGL